MVPRDFKTKPIKCRDGTLVYPFSIPGRDAQLQRLKKEGFDVLVIGGGCVGAGGTCVRVFGKKGVAVCFGLLGVWGKNEVGGFGWFPTLLQ